MNDSYTIKIDSVIISTDLITDLAYLINQIHDEIKTSPSDSIDYIFKRKHGQETTVHTKEECSKQRIPKDLSEINFYFYSNKKSLRISINIGFTAPDSKIVISSDDKVWNRGVAILLKEIIDEHSRKFNKWIRKRSSKIIVGLSILGLLYSIYHMASLLFPSDSYYSTLDDSQYLNLVLNLIWLTYIFPSGTSVVTLSFFFPAIEHLKMLRVKIRKFVGGLVILVIGGVFVEIFTNAISNTFKP